MDQPKDFNNLKHNEELFDVKRMLHLVLRYWHIFILSGFIGLGLAYIFNLYQEKDYSVKTKIIIPKKSNELDFQGLFTMSTGQTPVNSVNNDIELLNSIRLNQRVADELGWRVFCYEKRNYTWHSLYSNCPFIVVENGVVKNKENIKIYISVISKDIYQLTVYDDSYGKLSMINPLISENIEFGKPFVTNDFNFTLFLKPGEIVNQESQYYLEFKNRDNIALSTMRNLTVKLDEEQGEVVSLNMLTTDPERGVHYLNKLVEVYIDLKLEQKTSSQKKSIDFISKQITGISDSLYVSENSFTNYRSENQVIDLSQQGNIILQSLNEIQIEKNNIEMQMEYFKSLQRYLGNDADLSKIISPSVVGIADQSFVSLVQRMIELSGKRELMSYTSKEINPQFQLLNQEIIQVNKLLSENLSNLIQNAQNNIKILTQRYNQTSNELNTLPEKEQQLLNIKREYEFTSEIYTYMLQKKAEIELALAATTVDIVVVDEASFFTTKLTGRSVISLYVLGLLVGIMVPIFLLVLKDIFNNKIRNKFNIQNVSSIPVLGSLIHAKETGYLQVVQNPGSLLSESFRSVRVNIKFFLNNQNEKIIGVNSALSGEGKTFAAVNLASVFALADKKTLVIGCDMRRPKLAGIFNVSNSGGLSNYLTEEKEINEVIIPTSIDNLYVLPAGPVPPNPLELIERGKFEALLTQAKTLFDYIILDNPPCLVVSDGIVASKQCDLNIFIVRAGQTNTELIEGINTVVADTNLKNPCFVLNDQTLTDYSYGQRYNYRYKYNSNYYHPYTTKKNKTKTERV